MDDIALADNDGGMSIDTAAASDVTASSCAGQTSLLCHIRCDDGGRHVVPAAEGGPCNAPLHSLSIMAVSILCVHVLPVLWMTSRLHTMTRNKRWEKVIFKMVQRG